jgi:peptide/nickel transport system substrate-binding protein
MGRQVRSCALAIEAGASAGRTPLMSETAVRFQSRRSAIRLLTMGLGGLVLGSCGPVAPSSQAVSTAPAPSTPAVSSTPAPKANVSSASAAATIVSPPQPAVAQPKSGGTIRTGQVGDIANLDGHYANQLSATTVQLAYEKLVVYDLKLQPQPVLAESWDVSSDSKTFKFNLRKGVQFHNGREFTSDDVKYNLLRVRDPSVAPLTGTLAPQSAWFTGIETPDKYTIVLTADKPRPGIFDFLSGFNMVDKDTIEGPNGKTTINGTGSFKFVEWASGNHITLARNPNYWQTARPYIDGIQVSILRDPQTMVTQLEAGALDAVYAPPLTDTVRLKQNPSFQALVNPQLGQFFYVNQNVTLPLFQNKALRQAMNYALNRQRIAQTVLQNLCGDPVCLPWPQQSPAFQPDKNSTYSFDLSKAAALLKEAGVSGGSLDIAYNTGGYGQEFGSMAQIYQADLQSLGFQVTLKPMDGPTFTQSGQQHTYQGLRIGSGAGAGNFEASTMLQSTSAFNYAGNFAGFKDDAYAQLVLSATTEPEAAKRKQAYSQLNDYLLDQSFTFAFAWYPSTALVSSKVHALDFSGSAALSYVNAWLE